MGNHYTQETSLGGVHSGPLPPDPQAPTAALVAERVRAVS